MENSFLTAMQTETDDSATTWNGAVSHATTSTVKTGGALVNYLFKALRSTPEEALRTLWVAAKSEDAAAARLLAFFTRDRFKGKGERAPFQAMLKHEVEHGNLAEVEKWFPLISYFGYPKDLLCLSGTKGEAAMLNFFCQVLVEDERRMQANKAITLFSKYAPTESAEFDKKFKLVGKMCKQISEMRGKPFSKKNYRQMIASMRAYMKLPERLMCLGMWDTIVFSSVPSRCMHNNKKAFERHSPDAWSMYTKKLASGEAKVNSEVFPHDLAAELLQGGKFNQVAQSQWETLRNKAQAEFLEYDMKGILVMADTSGSMTTSIGKSKVRCLDVAVGLGLFFAELLPGPWKDTLMTFSNDPLFFKAVGTNLAERLAHLTQLTEGKYWGMSTNLQGALKKILDTAVKNNVAHKDMPSVFLIISDMQFNSCGSSTNLQAMRQEYANSIGPDGTPYTMPTVVFWNVNGSTSDFPAQADEDNVCLLSGFSPSILRLVFTGELNPVQIVRRAISDPRYNVVLQKEQVDWKKFLYADFEKNTKVVSEMSQTMTPEEKDEVEVNLIKNELKEVDDENMPVYAKSQIDEEDSGVEGAEKRLRIVKL